MIYGVDISKLVSPIVVREAIFKCFFEAHKEVLDQMRGYSELKNEKEKDEFRRLEIKLVIKEAFKKAKANYDNPTKDDLINVIDNLAEFSEKYRMQEIIKKHYNEIMILISKLD